MAQRVADGAADVLGAGVDPTSLRALDHNHVAREEHAEGALCSSSHGAGRALARGEARRAISAADLERQATGVWFDRRLSDLLRDEAPAAYKDIGRVMRAQRVLTRVERPLRPLLSYK